MSSPRSPQRTVAGDTIARAVGSDAAAAGRLLLAWSRLSTEVQSRAAIDDLSRSLSIIRAQLGRIVEALISVQVLSEQSGKIELLVSRQAALEAALFLEGFAYARHSHKDANRVDITLSPPSHPSELMKRLPKQGFAWAGLDDTRDNLLYLARCTQKRLAIVSPFVDEAGLAWIESLFNATPAEAEKVLIVRAHQPHVRSLVTRHFGVALTTNIKIYSYALSKKIANAKGYETFHAKIVLADRESAYIGSSNMNLPSREISLECGVTLHGPCVHPVSTLVDTIISISDRV